MGRAPDMFDFTLEWTNLRSPAERAISAKAVTDHAGVRETLILPLVLLITFLFALGIMTSARLRGHHDQALSYAAFAGVSMGMPMLTPATNSCRRPPGAGSASRLRHADVLALLAAD